MQLDSTQKPADLPPLFRADRQTLTFEAQKDGKVRVTCSSWEDYKVVREGEAFEVRWGSQGVEGRVVARIVPPVVEERDPFWVPDDAPVAIVTAGGILMAAPHPSHYPTKLPTLSAADIASIKSAGGPVLVASKPVVAE